MKLGHKVLEKFCGDYSIKFNIIVMPRAGLFFFTPGA